MNDIGPLDGLVLFVAIVQSDLSPSRVLELIAQTQVHLGSRLEDYRREFECVHEADDRAVFLVPPDHWQGIANCFGLDDDERDVLRRAHDEQALRIGDGTDRHGEFESALEIRDAVVVGLDPSVRDRDDWRS